MRIYSNYSQKEYDRIKEIADSEGMSMNQLQAYALLLHCDMPRKQNQTIGHLKNEVIHFINNFKGETFICSAPFTKSWASFTAADKDQVAKLIKSYEIKGYLEIDNKSSNLNHYRKLKDIPQETNET